MHMLNYNIYSMFFNTIVLIKGCIWDILAFSCKSFYCMFYIVMKSDLMLKSQLVSLHVVT